MRGRHRAGCKKGCAGCDVGCHCHGAPARRKRTAVQVKPPVQAEPVADLKTSVVKLRMALDGVKAYVATVARDIEATSEELWGMIGGND